MIEFLDSCTFIQLIKRTEKLLKENRTLNIEGHYFDDEDLCENKILEESKLETAVKFKDVSGKNRPVRSDSAFRFRVCSMFINRLHF